MSGWRDDALCATEFTPEEADALFYGFKDSDERAAKNVCGRCSVREDCLEDAMHMEGGSAAAVRFGVRGGLTGEERAQLHARRRRATWRSNRKPPAGETYRGRPNQERSG